MNAQANNILSSSVVVTNRMLCTRPLVEQVERLCKLGAHDFILREKDLSAQEYEHLAQEVLCVCAEYDATCWLHTHLDIAAALHCRRIHLPLPALQSAAPGALRAFEEIGCSVHSPQEALAAQALGATRLIAGHVYETQCKPGLEARGLEFLQEVCACAEVPVYAIGGIDFNPDRIQACTDRGAAGTCAMSAAMRL